MKQKRLADLIIFAVRKDEYKRIEKVKVGIDVIDNIAGSVVLTKEQVIGILKDGAKIKTAYLDVDKKYLEGSIVQFFLDNGVEYLKTIANGSEKDNLDNLPEF
jgi:hypothetical protein